MLDIGSVAHDRAALAEVSDAHDHMHSVQWRAPGVATPVATTVDHLFWSVVYYVSQSGVNHIQLHHLSDYDGDETGHYALELWGQSSGEPGEVWTFRRYR
ncbi:hypothetical protein [Mycolicibacterium mageritense]|uniref:hypothetical protein n=1 Tax=Mycolicibacterium mageritense TaxID=53462 RepID=UPI0011DC5FB2|nr:hypothetical protein [Mycolicibacterium mageritense]TXI53158.1 MAG: hypothetical protein E6Q55_35765 [Mycolicibacterium mageritense]